MERALFNEFIKLVEANARLHRQAASVDGGPHAAEASRQYVGRRDIVQMLDHEAGASGLRERRTGRALACVMEFAVGRFRPMPVREEMIEISKGEMERSFSALMECPTMPPFWRLAAFQAFAQLKELDREYAVWIDRKASQ